MKYLGKIRSEVAELLFSLVVIYVTGFMNYYFKINKQY